MYSLPVVAKSADPANLGTADCAMICHCDDGSDYAVKDASSGRYVAHSEWFCKHLGDQVGITSPVCRLVEVNGETAFGSRWESGHKPENWWARVRNGEIKKDRISPVVSRIYAFDLFINNIDRHGSNYIVRPQAGGQWSMLAFDHSRAWIATGWPLAKAPMDVSVVTRKNFVAIDKFLNGILEKSEAHFVLDKLATVPTDFIERILSTQHDSWLPQNERDAILNFWDNDLAARLQTLKEGFNKDEYV